MRLEGFAPLDDCWGSWLPSLLPWVSFPSWCFFVWASSLLSLFIPSWFPCTCFLDLAYSFPFGPDSLFWASLTMILFRPQQWWTVIRQQEYGVININLSILLLKNHKWDLCLQLMQVQLFQKEKVPKREGEVIGVFYFLYEKSLELKLEVAKRKKESKTTIPSIKYQKEDSIIGTKITKEFKYYYRRWWTCCHTITHAILKILFVFLSFSFYYLFVNSLMIAFYHHINTPIGFLCKWEINSRTFFDDKRLYY